MKGAPSSNKWRNWTGDQVCRPAVIERPRDKEELARALARAQERGLSVRVAGSGHSFNDAVLTNGMLLSLARMNRLVEVDPSSRTVQVEAGIPLSQLNESLDQHDLAMENLGDIAVQSLAGATATGTHGTGIRSRNLSASIESIELMLADGSAREVNEASDVNTWRAARISLGALGVVTAIRLRVTPAFTLRGRDETAPLRSVLEELDALVENNDHFEFYSFPHSKTAWTRVNNRVDQEPRPRSRASSWFHETFLVNTMFGIVAKTGRAVPKLIPRLNRITASLAGGGERIDRSYRIFASPRLVRFTESEYAIPYEHTVDVIRAIHDTIYKNDYDVSFPMEVRFVAPDDALLSPAQGRKTAYVAVHMYEKMAWEPYFRSVAAIMRDVGGRPHWGKRHFETASTLRPLYPDWDLFQEVRSRLDPRGVFSNGYVRRVLGPPGP